MLKTIKTPLTALIMFAIVIVGFLSIYISLQEHENLYRESVKRNLDGLSENLSNDLVTLLAYDALDFELSTILLRLDRYENVKYAIIFDQTGSKLSEYVGLSKRASKKSVAQPLMYFQEKYSLGMSVGQSELVAFKVIGDVRLPQGYLLIVNDLYEPLASSERKMLNNILPLIALVIFVSLLCAYLLLRPLLAPLTDLSKFADKVRQTNNYSLRPNIKGRYEIAMLSTSIEEMMRTVNQQMNKNKEYTEQLIEQQKTMERLANFDSLTGLPNRQFFVEMLRVELCRAKRDNSDVAILFFDLDGFKDVNDSFGHEIGDKLLIEIGIKVKNYVRDGDIVSRLGGDEFLILVHDNPDEYLLAKIAQRIVTGLSETIDIEGWQLNVGASIGIARASQSNFNLSEFISNADLAMYRSKLDGKGKYTVFVESMMEDNKRKLQIANSIEQAIEDNKMELFYQPKVDIEGKVLGYEALIRWTDQELGFVSPAEFIPIAEQSGKISMITFWVIERAMIEFSKVQQKHHKTVKISINLSALDIKNKFLFDEINSLLRKYNVAATAIEFEVTESAYLENFTEANKFFGQLKELGCSIALDDFGTGYSSLAYLTQISLDTLKIDKQFIDNLGYSDQSNLITIAIIDMANRLKLEICAEGVETREQADFLISHGCQQLQGYFFGKPLPLAKLPTQRIQ